MGPIPYYFLWSKDYEIFANILKVGISQYPQLFEERGIYIPQERYDETLNKAPGHFLCGSYLKLEKTYELLSTLPENSYFLFSDADILLLPGKPLEQLLNLYTSIQADMVCMREAANKQFYNIGFGLLRVNDKTRAFFKLLLDRAYARKDGLDGSLFNQHIKEFAGTVYFFPHELVITSSTIFDISHALSLQTMMPHVMVFQALCDPTKPKQERLLEKLKQYKSFGVPIEFH
jgi:hypothetical protein